MKPRWKSVVELLFGIGWMLFNVAWFSAFHEDDVPPWLFVWFLVAVINVYWSFALIRHAWKEL